MRSGKANSYTESMSVSIRTNCCPLHDRSAQCEPLEWADPLHDRSAQREPLEWADPFHDRSAQCEHLEWADPFHDRSAQCAHLEWAECFPWKLVPSAFGRVGTQQPCGQSHLSEGKSTQSLRLVCVATLYPNLMNKHWASGEEAD